MPLLGPFKTYNTTNLQKGILEFIFFNEYNKRPTLQLLPKSSIYSFSPPRHPPGPGPILEIPSNHLKCSTSLLFLQLKCSTKNGSLTRI